MYTRKYWLFELAQTQDMTWHEVLGRTLAMYPTTRFIFFNSIQVVLKRGAPEYN